MKTLLREAWLLVLLMAVALILAACGGAGGGQQGSGSGSEHESAERTGGGMAGMDHSQMDHGSMGMGSGEMAGQMVMENGKYSDKAFIDAMIPHHQSAISMAEVSHEKSHNPHIRELAGHIISAQKAEIEHMTHWRQQWYQEG